MSDTQRWFTPAEVNRQENPGIFRGGAGGDRRDGEVYVYRDPRIALAVNIAHATRRPLLLTGPSGSGKSSLALNVALTKSLRYYEHVVTARGESTDLMWGFDTIRRLNDAQSRNQKLLPDEAYVEPRALWWAFNRESAKHRGEAGKLEPSLRAEDPCDIEWPHAIVLIDEIDKADPDMPNNLLVALGSLQFEVAQTRFPVRSESAPLIMITSNGERSLPVAFVRRCVILDIDPPESTDLVEIAKATIDAAEHDIDLFTDLADFVNEESEFESTDQRATPSTAEYLDTVRACLGLGVRPGTEEFEELAKITLKKTEALR